MNHQYWHFEGDMISDQSIPDFDAKYSKLAIQHLIFAYSWMKEMKDNENLFDQSDILAADTMTEQVWYQGFIPSQE